MVRCGVATGIVCLVLAALDASAQTARITGRVTDSVTSAPLVGVTVAAVYSAGSNVSWGEAVTDASGQYAIDIAPGAYNLRATKSGYAWSGLTTSSARSCAPTLHDGR